MELRFWKYEGAGNDFILVDGRGETATLHTDTIRKLCDRHKGIGADGLMLLLNLQGYDFRMRYFNADGGEADMCGNGGRCIALFADDLGIGDREKLFSGRDGNHSALISSKKHGRAFVEIGMRDVDGYAHIGKAFFLDTGVPHYVEFVEDVDSTDVAGLGNRIRNDERFAAGGGTNVNFVQILSEGRLKIRTYERGVEGETLACGTGAVAAAIATHLHAQGGVSDFRVIAPGGELYVKFRTDDNRHFREIKLGGPARFVFSGSVDISGF